MLAGPIPRHTKRLSIGSVDQLIGVGVGLGVGVAVPVRAGEGLCEGNGVWEATGPSARAANTPKVIASSPSAPIAASSPPKSRAEQRISLIWGILSNYLLVKKLPRSHAEYFEENPAKNYENAQTKEPVTIQGLHLLDGANIYRITLRVVKWISTGAGLRHSDV